MHIQIDGVVLLMMLDYQVRRIILETHLHC